MEQGRVEIGSKKLGEKGTEMNDENMAMDKDNELGNTENRKIRKEKDVLRLGTWNVRGLNGKEMELINEFERAKLEILVIPETKRKDKGMIELDKEHLLIWSGVDNKERAQAGIGCMLHKDIKDTLYKWEAISERVLVIEMRRKTMTGTVIAVYGPDEGESVVKKEKFWEDLNAGMEMARGRTYIAGDFNARVGKKDNVYNTVIGMHGEVIRNNNGKRLLDFCIVHNLVITNSFYEHKDIHKYTRVQHSRGEKSIIDYIITEKGNRVNINDVAVKRGFEISSDHHLLVAKIKRTEGESRRQKRSTKTYTEVIRSYKLRNQEIANKYEQEINRRLKDFKENANNNGVEATWKIFKTIILESAQKVCGTCRYNEANKRTAWWSEEIKKQVKIKKQKWQEYLRKKTQQSYEEYKAQRIEVKNKVIEAKRKKWEEFGDKMETNSKDNQKLFFRVIKSMRGEKRVNSRAIKNEEGDILTEEVEIMNRWKEYFQKLLNTQVETQQENEEDQVSEEEERGNEEDKITKEELKEAINELKNGKAPGSDRITTEMIKYMGESGTQLCLKVLNTVWQEEKIPIEWEMGLIMPIFKKGDNRNCNNYRGITLLSTLTKVLEKIIEKRLRWKIEPTLSEVQSGFRKGRCTQDHVFTIKEITSRIIERKKTAYLAFIDMEKAFDRVPRAKIWKCLRKREVSNKLIKVAKSLYKRTRNCVISKNLKSEPFITNEGVRQGGSLSPLLFIIFMDEIIKIAKQRLRPFYVGYRNLERVNLSECAFADDIAIIAGSEADLQYNLNIWNDILEDNGMKVNIAKTKVMVVAEENRNTNISLNGELIEQVSSFQYLGVTLEEKGNQEAELNARLDRVNKVYHALSKGLINKKEVSRNTKIKVYKAVYRPILTYGCETWVLSEREKSKVGAAEMKYLRRVKGVTRRDRIRNDDIRAELNIKSVQEYIEQRQLGWWGHLQRLNSTVPVKKVWKSRATGRRKRGRPRKTWNETLDKILRKKGKTWNEAKQIALDKKRWKQLINS